MLKYNNIVSKQEVCVSDWVKSGRYDFTKMYLDFEKRYNPYPCDMTYSSAFGHALKDGLITEDIFNKARDYYGSLWNYVGD